MSRVFRMIQLNVRKQGEVHDSLMNDGEIQDTAVLAIQEPQAHRVKGRLLTTPMGHHKWTKIVPSCYREGRWPVRSMLWVNKDVEAEQIPIESPDMTAAILRLPGRQVLVVSVYVPCADAQALRDSCNNLRKAVRDARQNSGSVVDVMITGDFNRHDQLWGGDEISLERQGEADPIIDMMNELALNSLLPRGTKTWQNGDHETTIDLTLASEGLSDAMLKCAIHQTDHGADHRAIDTVIDISVPTPIQEDRLLLKNASWKEINARIALTLGTTVTEGTVQQMTDRLMETVQEAIQALTPKARPTPYTKRWWTTDLTQLRRIYTYWRNRARGERRAGWVSTELEDTAKAAAKQYHSAVRQQKKRHWEEFLADNDNIWKAAKYLKSNGDHAFGKVPQLVRVNGTITVDHGEQAEELLTTFFPSLPDNINDEGPKPQRDAIAMPTITMEEIERQLWAAKSWKAPGDDGLPVAVWQKTWPVVKSHVLTLFRRSMEEGTLPSQWRHAKIIPLKKPGKDDYTAARSWRPISLLATLGKVLESVIAERISHAVETYGLLPTNHFGARKQRSAEQALVLLQEQIYTAWRGRRIFSLISFDVKGAYNGVCKERLIQRMRARGIPEKLLQWVDAFCSERTATIQINGQSSLSRSLRQAGLPQGSPLSPILFLFFNADLVQRQIDSNGGAIAFVDDFSAWVTGPTVQSNRAGIEAIINDALEWEKRSGATFEAEKTAIIHFTKKSYKTNADSFIIKGQTVQPKKCVKILGVLMDDKLKYREHVARAASKGLEAAMELRRLKGLSPSTARQLFSSTVAPVVDYASNVWMHVFKDRLLGPINRVQRTGAQAIVGTFSTVATAVAEAEAHISSARDRFWRRAVKLWTDVHTLPETNPLRRTTSRMRKFRKQYRSPLYQVADALEGVSLEKLETIRPYLLPPWKERLHTVIDDSAAAHLDQDWAVRMAVSSSARNGVVGAGGAIELRMSARRLPGNGNVSISFSSTLGQRAEQNPYSGELVAMADGLDALPKLRFCRMILTTRSKAAVQALRKPRQQSGQAFIRRIYDSAKNLKRHGNTVTVVWLPINERDELLKLAKDKAKAATRQGCTPLSQLPSMRSTTLNLTRAELGTTKKLPDNVGQHSKRIDKALPGKHTRQLYEGLSWREATVLAQLRTGMARLNTYLHRINAAPTDQCECGQARETVDHFLFRCTKWTQYRTEMMQCTATHRGNISFYLGGKLASDDKNWAPNMDAVRATIRYAIATGRLDANRLT